MTRLHNGTNRLGFALQLCTLSYLGLVPEDLHQNPKPFVEFLARQLSAPPELHKDYGSRPQPRAKHLSEIKRNPAIGKLNFVA